MAQSDITFQADSAIHVMWFSSDEKDDVYLQEIFLANREVLSEHHQWCYYLSFDSRNVDHCTLHKVLLRLQPPRCWCWAKRNRIKKWGGWDWLTVIATVPVAVFFLFYFTSEKNSSLMTARVLGSLLVKGTIMLFHIPASLAPEHHLCTEAVEESESSLQLRLPCVYFDLGHVAPRLGSGFYKGQSWWQSPQGVGHVTMELMALWVWPETLACIHLAQNISPCPVPGLQWLLGWSEVSWWQLQKVVLRTELWGPGWDHDHWVNVQSVVHWGGKMHST